MVQQQILDFGVCLPIQIIFFAPLPFPHMSCLYQDSADHYWSTRQVRLLPLEVDHSRFSILHASSGYRAYSIFLPCSGHLSHRAFPTSRQFEVSYSRATIGPGISPNGKVLQHILEATDYLPICISSSYLLRSRIRQTRVESALGNCRSKHCMDICTPRIVNLGTSLRPSVCTDRHRATCQGYSPL